MFDAASERRMQAGTLAMRRLKNGAKALVLLKLSGNRRLFRVRADASPASEDAPPSMLNFLLKHYTTFLI